MKRRKAVDGHDALHVMVDENPDLAVIDLMMPNMDSDYLIVPLADHTNAKGVPEPSSSMSASLHGTRGIRQVLCD